MDGDLKTLAERGEAQAVQIADDAKAIAGLQEQVRLAAAGAEAEAAVLKAAGFESVAAMAEALAAKDTALKAAGEQLAEREAEVTELKAAAQTAVAEAKFAEVAPAYDEAVRPKVREALLKCSRGEALSMDEMVLMASGKGPVTAPSGVGTAPVAADSVGAPVLMAAGGDSGAESLKADIVKRASEQTFPTPHARQMWIGAEVNRLLGGTEGGV